MSLGANQDGHVQVAVDGAGKKIDNAQLTREPDPGGTGETVLRQRVVVSSDENPRLQAGVRGEAGDASLAVQERSAADIHQVLVEIRDLLRFVVGT